MKQLAFLMIALLPFAACNQSYDSNAGAAKEGMQFNADYAEERQLTAYADEAQPAPPIEEKVSEKKLIRTARLHIKVEDYAKAKTTLDELLTQFQAEVTYESQNSRSDGYSYDFTIRVIPADFEAIIAKIEELASYVYTKNIEVQDVTRQYVDLETRLASKRAVIAQYRALLQDAKSVEDVLAVSEELNEVIEDVESTEAQLRALRNDVQYSTINLTIFDEHTIPNVERENFFSRIGKGLFNGWQLLLNIFVGLISIWPVVLIVIGSVWLLRRWWKKRKA